MPVFGVPTWSSTRCSIDTSSARRSRGPTAGAPPATAPRRRRGWIPRRARRGPARPGRREQRSQRGAAHRASARPGPAPTRRARRGRRARPPGASASRGPSVSRSSRARSSGSTSRPSGAETRRARSTASAEYAGGAGSARRTPTRRGRCSGPITISHPCAADPLRPGAGEGDQVGARRHPVVGGEAAEPVAPAGTALGERARGPGVGEHGPEVGAEHQDRRPPATGRAARGAAARRAIGSASHGSPTRR